MGAPVPRRLTVTPDRIQSHGLDLTGVLKPSGTGLVWTAIEEGTPIANSRASKTRDDKPIIRSSLVQVTNLGISIKDSPQNTLVFVTRLDTAAPVPGARVSIVVPVYQEDTIVPMLARRIKLRVPRGLRTSQSGWDSPKVPWCGTRRC